MPLRPASIRHRAALAAHYLGGLGPWHASGLALACGLMTALALPPVFCLPVLLVTFPVLIWLLEGTQRRRHAFAIGWSFGFGHFSAGLYWLAHALLLDPLRFGWMIPFAVGGLSALMAGYTGAATALVQALRLQGLSRILGLASLWTVMEILRGWLFTGFPWNPLGSVWTGTLPVLQASAWIGISGLSLLTVVLASLPAMLTRSAGGYLLGAGGVLLAGLAIGGTLRIPEETAPVVPGVRLRIVQPAIPQVLKWQDEARMANLGRYLSLSMAPQNPGEPSPTHVIWGETALPWVIDGTTDTELRAVLSTIPQQAAKAGAHSPLLVTGAVRRTPPGQKPYRIWNSMVALDAAGSIRGSFDKAHLVPFGEYVPLRTVLPFEKLTPGQVDYSAGPGPQTVNLPGLPPVSPLICYEVVFSGAVTTRNERPDWLLNLTNDGWYGVSSGPYQHLATAIGRAVEEGLPLVRAANTGISAVIDPWGRLIASLDLNAVGFLDSDLPKALPATPYSQWHHRIPFWLSVVVLIIALVIRSRSTAGHTGMKCPHEGQETL